MITERHPLQVLRIVEEGVLAKYNYPEILRRHNCTVSEFHRLKRQMSTNHKPLPFSSLHLALDFVGGVYDRCQLAPDGHNLIVQDSTGIQVRQINKPEGKRTMGAHMSEAKVNEIAELMIDNPNDSNSVFAQLFDVHPSQIEYIRKAKSAKLSPRNRRLLEHPEERALALQQNVEDQYQDEAAEEAPESSIEPTSSQELTMPTTTKSENSSIPPKMETKELIMLLIARMKAEGTTKLEISDTGEVKATVTQIQSYKL